MREQTFEISNDHILPETTKGTSLIYPFDKLQKGQSFSVPKSKMLSARRAAHQYGARHGKTFASRGNRIWRIT